MSEARDLSATECPEPEEIAIYIDGGMDPSARLQFEAHLADCDRCRELFAEVIRTLAPAGAGIGLIPFRRARMTRVAWIGAAVVAAAALLIVALRLQSARHGLERMPEFAELVAAVSTQPTRPTSGRLTGGFTYAPPPEITRAGEREAPTEVRIAAATIEKKALVRNAADHRAARGVAALVLGDVARAIELLGEAAKELPDRAEYQNDLAVAYLTRGQGEDSIDDYRQALSRAEAAVRADPRLLEAWFNRALSLEALNRRSDAQNAWQDLLIREPASPWAREAETHLRNLSRSGGP